MPDRYSTKDVSFMEYDNGTFGLEGKTYKTIKMQQEPSTNLDRGGYQ